MDDDDAFFMPFNAIVIKFFHLFSNTNWITNEFVRWNIVLFKKIFFSLNETKKKTFVIFSKRIKMFFSGIDVLLFVPKLTC